MENSSEIKQFLPLLYAIARRIYRTLQPNGLDEGDLVSWGYIGLQDGLNKYDPARNPNLSNFLSHRIQWSISDCYKTWKKTITGFNTRKNNGVEPVLHLDDIVDSWEPSQEASQEDLNDRSRIWIAIQRLPLERHQRVIKMHYYDGMSLSEIGEIFGFSKQWSWQILREALEQLRKDPLFKRL